MELKDDHTIMGVVVISGTKFVSTGTSVENVLSDLSEDVGLDQGFSDTWQLDPSSVEWFEIQPIIVKCQYVTERKE